MATTHPTANGLLEALGSYLRILKLPTVSAQHEELARQAEKSGWTFGQFLHRLCELEVAEREQRRVARLQKHSGLPLEKTMASLDMNRFPAAVRRVAATLCDGAFAGRAEDVLAFGLPGRGKTHLLCAIAHELIRRGIAVLFVPAYRLVQMLLAAKRDLRLDKELKRLDNFTVVLIDDIGYVQQDREEMEVLFTFLAERYERKSVMITSNLVFSQWDRIFKDAMTTAAAIDRLVHHSIILELNNGSIREDEAKKRVKQQKNEEEKPTC